MVLIVINVYNYITVVMRVTRTADPWHCEREFVQLAAEVVGQGHRARRLSRELFLLLLRTSEFRPWRDLRLLLLVLLQG